VYVDETVEQGDPGHTFQYAQLGPDIGHPCAAMQPVGTGYSRVYSKGFAAANVAVLPPSNSPPCTGCVTFAPPQGTYYAWDPSSSTYENPQYDLTLPPQAGLVLVLTPGSVPLCN
jgi:hypothetical protein